MYCIKGLEKRPSSLPILGLLQKGTTLQVGHTSVLNQGSSHLAPYDQTGQQSSTFSVFCEFVKKLFHRFLNSG